MLNYRITKGTIGLKQKGKGVTVYRFMRDLGIIDDELITYAVIYAYSNNGKGIFAQKLDVLCLWTGLTEQKQIKALQALEKKGIIAEVENIEISQLIDIEESEERYV